MLYILIDEILDKKRFNSCGNDDATVKLGCLMALIKVIKSSLYFGLECSTELITVLCCVFIFTSSSCWLSLGGGGALYYKMLGSN